METNMSSKTHAQVMETVHHSIKLTEPFALSSNQSSGVYRMRTFFEKAADPNTTDPIKLLKRARHEANFLYGTMAERATKQPDCPELGAYAVLCSALNGIPACTIGGTR